MANNKYDVIIIGSGFGGSMMAQKLAADGRKVAVLERGDWVKRGAFNWERHGSLDLTKHYDHSTAYNVEKGGNKKQMGVYSAVGGPSNFYGGVSFRFRERDFEANSELTAESQAEWPVKYAELEPYYCQAEDILQIAGKTGDDITAPPRSKDLPQTIEEYADISLKIKSAAEGLGLHPSRLPMAINHLDTSRNTCKLCTTCDTFACAIKAKNDLDTMVLSKAVDGKSYDILPNLVVYNLVHEGGKISKVLAVSKIDNQQHEFAADLVVLSAGALASPHILLSSGLEQHNPAGKYVGRYLMRHVNAIIFGIFPGIADKQKRFHKELAIMDFYFGADGVDYPSGKLGSLQQVATPPAGLVENVLPFPIGKVLSKAVGLLTGLLAIAEDQPRFDNYIKIDSAITEKYGLKKALVSHEYSDRDNAAMAVLSKNAKAIMKKAGAISSYTHHIRTFSHAVGTVRMGDDENTAPLDRNCQFRGINNLFVVDGSFMPTSAAVNPSLTISANALRVADYIIQNK